MKIVTDYYTPLINYFPIPEEYHDFQIIHLAAYLNNDPQPSLSRIINSLSIQRYFTVGSVIHATWHELGRIRNIGTTSQLLLFNILQRVTDDPERLRLEPSKQSIDKMSRLIRSFEQRNPPTHEEQLKQDKLDAIKRKLQSMGLII